MVDVQAQRWRLYRGEDRSVVLTGADDTDPTGWAFLATIARHPGGEVVFSTTSVAVGGAGPYTLTFTLSRAVTSALIAGDYAMDVFRTDSGSSVRLAGGTLTVLTPVRPTA